MVLVEDSDPVLFGNKVESVVPYHTSDEFSVAAKQDGTVVDKTEDFLVVQYKDKKYQSIPIGTRVAKNSAAGFYIDNKLVTELNIGDKFKTGEVIAYNPKAFKKNMFDKGASMKLGVLAKVAVIPNWDIYEDSTPLSTRLANKLATEMISEQTVILDKFSAVDRIIKVGSPVRTGDMLIRFDREKNDDIQKLLDGIRQSEMEEIIDDVSTTVKAKNTGTVVDIKIYQTLPTSEFTPSVQRVIREHDKNVKRKLDTLDKYSNPGDLKNYKSGQIINETVGPIKLKYDKMNGEYVKDGLMIKFYIKYKDIAAKGDKICHEFALKGVASHVIPEGTEPWSEYRPDEPIDSLIAPLGISARKTPSIFLAMFTNKLIIELKRQLDDIYHDKK